MKNVMATLVATGLLFSIQRGAKANILVADYPMNEASWSGSAPQVADATGNGHNGTAIGGATTGQRPPIRSGWQLRWKRSICHRRRHLLDERRSVDYGLGRSHEQSEPAWYADRHRRRPGAGDFFGISGTGGENSYLPQYELYIDHWGVPAYHSTSYVAPDTWNQVVMTYNGAGTIAFYINGQSAGFATLASGNSWSLYSYDFSSYVIGGNTIGGTTTQGSFEGLMRNVEFYDYSLGAEQVASLYQSESFSTATPTWNVKASASWNTPGNWSTNTVPNGVGQQAALGTLPTTATTVSLDSAQTVGTLTFDNTAGYTLAAGNSGSLTLDNSGGTIGGQVIVLGGTH